MLISLLNWFTFLWLFFLMIFSIKKIVKGYRQSVNFIIPVLFIFCGLPLFFDEIVGRLAYNTTPGFALAAEDDMTNIIYCFYVAISPLILLVFGKSKSNPFCPVLNNNTNARFNPFGKGIKTKDLFICWLVLMCPIVLVFFSPAAGQYLKFSSTLRFSDNYLEFHGYVTLLCNLAILAGCYIIAVSPPKIYGRWPRLGIMLVVLFFIFLAFWVHGKRNIIVVMTFLLLMALNYRRVFQGIRVYILIFISFIFIMSYSFFFQSYTNRINTTIYENSRIDFGRDHTIKMTIFAELHPEKMQILDFRGQSILFHLTTYVPRSFWPDKPLPYAQYFTSAVFFSNPRFWGWGMTTSWLEETIANFSWLGMLIGPLSIAFVCRIGDTSKSNLVQILTPLIAILLLVVEATAFLPLILIWLFFVLRDYKHRKIRIK